MMGDKNEVASPLCAYLEAIDAHAEGLPAIGALALIVLALLVAKYLADL